MNVLYLSYDGMLEPLGQSQVLRYLERLAHEHKIILISFEKPDDWRQIEKREALRIHIRAAGIAWIPLRYHKRPGALSTALDIAQGIVVGSWLVMHYRIRIVHARSYVPSVIALVLKKLFRLKYIFDMRGFWADERVDGRLWPADGRLYRIAKWFERQFLLNADHVVSLTRAGVRELETFDYLTGNMPPISVISTCTDLKQFVPAADPRPAGFTLGYVGAAGTWYLFDEAVEAFLALLSRIPAAKMLILNRGEHEFILQSMKRKGVPPDRYELKCVNYAEVPTEMSRMNAGVFFIKPVFSKLASAPTKLGEFLGCGIPCISNAGVGDMAEILHSEHVGVAISGFTTEALDHGVCRIVELTQDSDISRRCREAAFRHFSLEAGVNAYKHIYETVVTTR